MPGGLSLRNKVSDHRETILGEVLGRIEEQWPGLIKSQRTMIEVLFGKQEAMIPEMAEAAGINAQAVRYPPCLRQVASFSDPSAFRAPQASTSRTTLPWMSVRRKSRPWVR